MVATMPIDRVQTVTESEARFSALLDAANLRRVTIICRAGRPVATISPYTPMAEERKPGALTGEFWMADDFDETPSDVIDDFEDAIAIVEGIGKTDAITTVGTFVISDEMHSLVQAELDRLIAQNRNPAFLLLDLETGAGLAYNIDTIYYSASGIKAHNMCALCYFVPESFTNSKSGMQATLQYSSNADYERVFNSYNDNIPNQWRERAHLGKQQWGRMYTNYSTRDNAKLWLCDWDFLSGDSEAARALCSWMEASRASAFAAVVGEREGYINCSKAGWESDTVHGCNEGGFIQTPGGTYLLVIMTSQGGTPDRVLTGLVSVLDDAYQAYAPQKARD